MVKTFYNKILKTILLLASFAILFSCSPNKISAFDRQTGLTKKEIKDSYFRTKKRQKAQLSKNAPFSSIPKTSKIIAIPSPPDQKKNEKLISFAITDEVPLKDVLIELSKVAKLDLDLDPGISGGVIVNAKNRPLTEILDRICEMGNLRYTLKDNRLHVERDLPFAKNYMVDFLIEDDLWSEITDNIDAIITGSVSDSGSESDSNSDSSSSLVSANKLANIIMVFASQKDHQKVADYLQKARKNASAQVLIEAKVVEVTLSDSYKTGIDWSWASKGNEVTITQTADGSDLINPNPISIVLNSKSLFGGNITSTISALEEFGTVKAIASPRINALNNQKATLNFSKKLVYFISDVSSNTTTTSGTSDTQNTVTSTKNEESTGTELTITPSINLVNNEVTLNVQPKITIKTDEVTQTVVNPIDNSEIINTIPVVNTRELSTIAKIQSGNILVIGGVMTEDTSNNETEVMFLSKIPILGNLFKSSSKISSVTETVIFIKATIIGSGDGVSKYDRKLHDDFTSSSRPFFKP